MAYMGCHMYSENSEEIIKPATDVFEINDFTAATEWENFIDDIENIFRNWKLNQTSKAKDLHKNDFLRGSWKCRKEKIEFYNFQFILYHYKLVTESESSDDDDGTSQMMSDIMSSAADFCPLGPRPAILFGLREVLVLGPDVTSTDDTLCNDTRAKMVLGAVNIALHNTGTELPCLVQVMQTNKHLYNGTWISGTARMDMTSVCLNKKPSHCNYLSGLLELFRNKINTPLPVTQSSPARVSVRFSYKLDDWAGYTWMIDPPDLDLFTMSGDTDFIQLSKLPFGCVSDPVSGLTLHTTWRDISEDLVTDTQVHSDLEPLEAPEWSIEVALSTDNTDCLLAKHLDKHLQLCSDTRTVKMLLGELTDSSEDNVASALDRISNKSGPSVSNIQDLVRPLNRRSLANGGPLKPALISYVLEYLFPDSVSDSSHPYSDTTVQLPDPAMLHVDRYTGTVKTCPYDSLVWRLAHAVSCCLQWAGTAGVAHIWHEVCLELRYRLENSILVPGLPSGNPDTAYCLLLQKLQMVNCCIARKISRETTNSAESVCDKTIVISDDEEDEFFECSEEVESSANKKPTAPAWASAEGRIERIGELRLLEVDEWMYRPIVQEPAPVTEDQLAESAEVMMQLGTDEAGAEIRAKMQSASLLSDMESFKAANPGCVLADFVRWHSPRDWDGEKGLSVRMRCEGNLWTSLWETARTVPARRQRRLFDDTKEGEKVMSFLTSLNPGDLASILHPTLLQAGHYRLLEATEAHDLVANLHSDTVKAIIQVSRLQCLAEVRHYRGQVSDPQFERRQQLCREVASLLWRLELSISQSLSLRKKFLYDLGVLGESEAEQPDALAEMERFVRSLASGGEVTVLGASRGPAGRLVQNIFKESHQEDDPRPGGLPQTPCVKQFVLRSLVSRPLPYSQPQPQRMYVKLGQGEFRLAGSFTSDRQYC